MKKNKSVSDTEDGSYSIHTNEERTEYFKKLERWLLEAYAWHSFIAAVPFILASSQIAHGSKLSNANANANVNANANANANVNANSNASNQQGNENSSHQRTNEQQMPFQAPGVNGIIYRIPPVWKRYVAEFIDSILMFILKMTVTFLTVDVFNFIDFEKYYLGLQPNLRINYKIALDLASRLLGVEIVSRVFACVFEASWLRFGINGHAGGATPGKLLMRLKVVHCQSVTPASLQDENLVTVVPGTDLGLLLAFGRSVMKHIILAILFPIFYCMCFFRFNRTGYDLCCNSIVVEDVSNENNLHNNNNNNNNNINNNNNNNIHNNNNINVQN